MINQNYQNLAGGYLFAELKRRVDAYQSAHPEAEIIRLGIGDVTQPLTPAVVEALQKAALEMGTDSGFHGYGPEQGYTFLQKAIIKGEYAPLGINISCNEIFISDGSKCDVGNIQEIFATDCVAAISDPVYPVYRDSNLMAGRKIVYLPCNPEHNFAPKLPQEPVEMLYLCSPNNPTGAALTREQLSEYVAYALENNSVILYDSAYSAYIQDPELPRSIYEIPGAEKVAIEFKSFSKTAGFTGLRCAFTVVPTALERDGVSLNALWNRRQCTKFNAVSYVVQRAAEAVYSTQGWLQTTEIINYYMNNARTIRAGLAEAGFEVFGGENAPYIWWKLPAGIDSMQFCDKLLEHCQVLGTPGVGFGPCGEGYFRLTAFGRAEDTQRAIERIVKAKERLLS